MYIDIVPVTDTSNSLLHELNEALQENCWPLINLDEKTKLQSKTTEKEMKINNSTSV